MAEPLALSVVEGIAFVRVAGAYHLDGASRTRHSKESRQKGPGLRRSGFSREL